MASEPAASRSEASAEAAAPARRDLTHWLYLAVIVAVFLGIVVGFVFPEFAVGLEWLGTAVVGLIEMLIAPVIFCTPAGRRDRRADRLLVRPRRHRQLPDDGIAVRTTAGSCCSPARSPTRTTAPC